jgi:hypothetical protein
MKMVLGEHARAGVRMRRRQQQSMPFGWVFVALTTLGAIGGVVTGLSAHSMRTTSGLPPEQLEPFEQTRSVVATAAVPLPAPQEMQLAAASTAWIEEPGLFSPVLAYPTQLASAPAAAPVETAVTAPEPVAPPALPTAAAKPNAQTPAAPARRVASRPGSVLNDAQIASIKKRLNLTPDQAPLWPAVETALRNISYKGKDTKVANLGNGTGHGPMAYVDTNSAEVQQLKYAALPLIMRLNDDQKREVKSMAYVMGLESVASSF